MASKRVHIFISKVCRDFCSRGVLEKMETHQTRPLQRATVVDFTFVPPGEKA